MAREDLYNTEEDTLGRCGECRFYKYDTYHGEYICGCESADSYGLATEYDSVCCDYE